VRIKLAHLSKIIGEFTSSFSIFPKTQSQWNPPMPQPFLGTILLDFRFRFVIRPDHLETISRLSLKNEKDINAPSVDFPEAYEGNEEIEENETKPNYNSLNTNDTRTSDLPLPSPSSPTTEKDTSKNFSVLMPNNTLESPKLPTPPPTPTHTRPPSLHIRPPSCTHSSGVGAGPLSPSPLSPNPQRRHSIYSPISDTLYESQTPSPLVDEFSALIFSHSRTRTDRSDSNASTLSVASFASFDSISSGASWLEDSFPTQSSRSSISSMSSSGSYSSTSTTTMNNGNRKRGISFISPRTKGGLREVSELAAAFFNEGWGLSKTEFARCLIFLWKYWTARGDDRTGNIIPDTKKVKVASYFLNYSMASYVSFCLSIYLFFLILFSCSTTFAFLFPFKNLTNSSIYFS